MTDVSVCVKTDGSGVPTDLSGALFVKNLSAHPIPSGTASVILSMPPAAAIDIYMQYRQPGEQPSVVSVDTSEYSLWAVNGGITSKVLTRRPSTDAVGTLAEDCRLFAVRDFPATAWELRVFSFGNTAQIFVDVVAIGWAKEPTGMGPHGVTSSSGKRAVSFPVGLPIVGFKNLIGAASQGPFEAKILAADYIEPRNSPISASYSDLYEQLGSLNALLTGLRDDAGVSNPTTSPADKQFAVLRIDAARRLIVNVETGTVVATIAGVATEATLAAISGKLTAPLGPQKNIGLYSIAVTSIAPATPTVTGITGTSMSGDISAGKEFVATADGADYWWFSDVAASGQTLNTTTGSLNVSVTQPDFLPSGSSSQPFTFPVGVANGSIVAVGSNPTGLLRFKKIN